MVLVASPLVFSIFLQLQTIAVRREMKQNLKKLEREQLVTLHLKPSEINWYKAGKELEIGNELFDVKTITSTDDGYIVTGLFDKKEKKLKKGLERLASKNQKQKTEKLLSFLQLIYHPPSRISIGQFCNYPKTSYAHFSDNILFTSFPVIIPPPKFSLVI
jgi:hypothetical protein